MAVKYRILTQAFPTSSADWEFDFGAVGEDLKLVKFVFCKYTDATFAAGWQNGLCMGYGFSDGAHHAGAVIASEHAASPTDSYQRGSTTKEIIAIDETNGATLFAAHVKNFTVATSGHKGLTLAIDTPAPGAGSQYLITAFGVFGDIEASVGPFNGEMGFQPDVGGILQLGQAIYDDTSYDGAAWSLGLFSRYPAIAQCARWWNLKDNNGGADPNPFWSYVASGKALVNVRRDGTIDDDVVITGVTPTGVTYTGVTGFDSLYWAIRHTGAGPLDIGLLTSLLTTSPTGALQLNGFRGTPAAMVGLIGKVTTKDAVATANAAQCFGMTLVDDQGSAVCVAIQGSAAGGSQRSQMKNKLFDIEQVTAPVGRYAGDFTSFSPTGSVSWNDTTADGTPYIQALGLGHTGATVWDKGTGKRGGAGALCGA